MRHGFIRDPKDIKYLIMYSMSFMPFAIGEGDLLDIVLVDDAFGYFEFSEAFHGLLDTRHVAAVETDAEKLYILTPDGQKLISDMYRELPSTVRDKAERAAMRVVMKIRRDSQIKTNTAKNEDGTFTVKLQICKDDVDHLCIDMMLMTERQCSLIEDSFRKNAEHIYSSLIALLSGTQIAPPKPAITDGEG